MTEAFTSLRIVGGLLPADVIGKIYAADPEVPGVKPETYGLEPGESVRRQASRVWPYLLEKWQEFKTRVAASPEAGSARITRERWLHILLRELGFTGLHADGGFDIGGKTYPVSHRFAGVPVHLLGWRTSLDHKTPHVAARPPQSMLQELLNRSDDYLWALLSNGSVLRLLRDSTALTGQAYVEFDLEAIFDGEIFSDFVCLYLICHASRFTPLDGDGPTSCYLEQRRAYAATQGERALAQLRRGVEKAISTLGTGFLAHPANQHLRARLDPRSGDLKIEDFNRSLLRLIYRLLFWFVAEDRDVLLDPGGEKLSVEEAERLRTARQRYETYFSSARLRKLARARRGDRHGDLWEAVQVVFTALGAEGGAPQLALPGIGGIFETELPGGRSLPLDEPLTGARLTNEALLGAVRALAIITSREGGGRRPVDFGNLGAEELGSVYEGLLEYFPRYDDEARRYTLETYSGHERKESGTYYTPSSLVECLLDSALDPLLDEACAKPTAQERIATLLGITVCDPACGSGHFLVAAARRIAKRIAAEETGEHEPPAAVVRTALRRVVGQCIYGVDINPMAAELAKVSLWMEATEPGKPLPFLDLNIRVGNSLLGVTPALLAGGLPDEAFKPIEGDDRKVAVALKKQSAAERAGQGDLFSPGGIEVSNAALAKRAAEITHTLPDSLEDLHIHQQRLAQQLAESPERKRLKLVADAWCAAFVQPKITHTRTTAITQAVLEHLDEGDRTLDLAAAEELTDRLFRQYRFFHWQVEFPHIFRTGNGVTDIDSRKGWSGGFTCIIGNPPWDQVQHDPREFFASRDPEIATAANMADRKKKIANMKGRNPALYAEHKAEQRRVDGIKHFTHASGSFPLTSFGRLNTYSLFAELAQTIISTQGRSGQILPTGIATDSFNQYFFRHVLDKHALASLFDFRNNKFFEGVAGAQGNRFCLLTLTGSPNTLRMRLAFRCNTVTEALNPNRQVELTTEEIRLLNPNSGTCSVFRSQRDADVTLDVYRRVPVLVRDEDPEGNPWKLSFQIMFMMNTDSGLFYTSNSLLNCGWQLDGNIFTKDGHRMIPLYEAKMIHHYDHRFGDYKLARTAAGKGVRQLPTPSSEQHSDPYYTVLPRYWIAKKEINARLGSRWDKGWLLGWRDITSGIDERTVIASCIPWAAAGDTWLLTFPPVNAFLLQANLSAFVLDYCARQKAPGTHIKFFVFKQLPILPPHRYTLPTSWLGERAVADWIRRRVLELTYTSWDMAPFARDHGDIGPPHRWDEERRFKLRAELDAAFFRLYKIKRDDVDYIMETFPIVKRKDIQRYGSFRTKELILEVYDAMTEASRSGRQYQTILDPPPGQGPRHPQR